MGDYQWLNRIVAHRGTFNICKRDPKYRNGNISTVYEGRWTANATKRAPLERLQKVLGGGQITRINNSAFKKGYAWYYNANGPQLRKLLEMVSIDTPKTRTMRAFVGTIQNNGKPLPPEVLMLREQLYQMMKEMNSKVWE